MNALSRTAAVLLMLAMSAGEAAMQPLADASPAAIQRQVKPGDEVRITVRDGRVFELKVTKVEAESLTGAAESGKHLRIRYAAIERIEIEDVVAAPTETVSAPDRPGNVWLGLSAGAMLGGVELPCGGGVVSQCHETGFFSSYGVSLTFAGEAALRLRAIRANEHDEHKPVETAILGGVRVGQGLYVMIGVGSISHPDDEYPGDSSTGLAWEFLAAPPSDENLSFELSFHGNHLGDAQYGGISLGMRFGKMR